MFHHRRIGFARIEPDGSGYNGLQVGIQKSRFIEAPDLFERIG
jgi:hypothetical protein